MLDRGGRFSLLLKTVSRCRECHKRYPDHSDLPHNILVRSLPLFRLLTPRAINDYLIRVKRDDGHLRNLFAGSGSKPFLEGLQSSRISIGLLPWLDRCMLDRTNNTTALMVVGIDFKHLSTMLANSRDRHLPLDTDRAQSNVWGATWHRFWRNLLGPDDIEEHFVDFLRRHGAYFTNSILCVGGGNDPRAHSWDYIDACRPHIEEQIRIVYPRCLVSFGDLGCRNVAKILSATNPACSVLGDLARTREPLRLLRKHPRKCEELLDLRFGSERLAFVPLYQPGWSHTASYRSDYGLLRKVLGLPTC